MNYQTQVMGLFDIMKENRTNKQAIEGVISYFNDLNKRGLLPGFPEETELREKLTWYSQREWLQQANVTLRRLCAEYNIHIKLDVDSEMDGYAYLATDRGTLYLHEEKCKSLEPQMIEAILTHEILHLYMAQQT